MKNIQVYSNGNLKGNGKGNWQQQIVKLKETEKGTESEVKGNLQES